MPSNCVFEFARGEPVYYSGESINGHAKLTTTNEKSVKDSYICFLGEGKVGWEEHRSHQRHYGMHNHTEYYRGNEIYVNARTKVLSECNLSPGTHTYAFSFTLPDRCPTSCVEKYGNVNYEIALVLYREQGIHNIFKSNLNIIRPLDLNQNPEYLIPIQSEDIKYFCCWPCSSGPVISTLTIPYGAYAPGQDLPFSLEIDNQSQGYDLEGVKLKLVQIYKFTAKLPRHKVRYQSNTLLKKLETQRCLRLSKRIIRGSVNIPPMPPTALHNDGLISLKYCMRFTILAGDCRSNSHITVPLTIGTVPLTSSIINPFPILGIHPSARHEDALADSPPNYEKYKPPSYEEVTAFNEQSVPKYQGIKNFVQTCEM